MDNIEEIREKELEVQKKQLFAQRVTAAASVASAVAAHKQAAATEQIQQQIAADSERNRLHQMIMATQQEKMVEEQRLTNFRNTVLATLPLLKDEEEKKQYLTEQLLPRLKEEIDAPILTPIRVISLLANTTLKNYVENEAGQKLKDFLSTGKDILDRTIEWNQKSEMRDKQVNEFEEAQSQLINLERPFGFRDVVKTVLWAILVFSVLYFVFSIIFIGNNGTTTQLLSEDSEYLKPQSYDSVYLNAADFFLGGSTVLGAILHFGLKRYKIKALKAKVKSLSPPDDLSLKKEREELGEKAKLQVEQWEVFKLQIVNYLMGIQVFKNLITGDPRSELLKITTTGLESCVNDLQSFLPPSSRLQVSHYAQYFIGETDVQNFRDGQTSVENDLKTSLAPDYLNQTIVLKNQQTFKEAGQVNTESASNMADVKSQPQKTAIQIADGFKSKIQDKRIFFHPNIPPEMLDKIGTTYAKAAKEKNESIICVGDDTVFAGNASDGFAITADAMYWHELGGENDMMHFRDMKQLVYQNQVFRKILKINNQVEVSTYMSKSSSMEQIVEMINALRDLG